MLSEHYFLQRLYHAVLFETFLKRRKKNENWTVRYLMYGMGEVIL